jgi:hypothetical protein
MAILAQDTFNRANASLSGATMSDGVSTWTIYDGSWNVVSNLGESSDTTGATKIIYSTTVTVTDGDVSAVVNTGQQGVVNRWSATGGIEGTGYLAYADIAGNSLTLFRLNGGSATSLASVSGVVSTDRIGVRCNGTSIGLLKNGSVVASATDATYASGYGGLYAYATGLGVKTYEDFRIDSLGGGSVAKSVLWFHLKR